MEKKFTTYDEIDFAEDPSFIRWVQGKDQQATSFWNKWMADHPDKRKTIQAAKTIVKSINIKEQTPREEQIKNLWNKIDAATVEKKQEAIVRPIGRRRWLSLAAAACVGFLAVFYLYKPTTSIQSELGEQIAYQLPDRSKVDLNADSKITFKEKGFNSERTIHLEGEAFFEIEKGTPFTVITPSGTIEVLGTRFNVNTRNNNLVVDCEEGKVRVTTKEDARILTAGLGTQLTEIKTGLKSPYQVQIDKKLGWKNGVFFFDNVALMQVVEELERQYAVTVSIEDDLEGRLGNYSFRKGDLEKALKEILFQVNGKFEVNDRQVVIGAK